jgi:hypothetical protein
LNPRDVALTAATAKSALRLGKVQQARQIVESRLKAGGVPSQRRAQLLSVMRAIALKEGNMREARLLEHKIARLRILAGREPAETQ